MMLKGVNIDFKECVMETQISVDQILDKASQLNKQDLERLLTKLNLLRARYTAPSLSKKETNLLKKINAGFPAVKWARIAQLDAKMEFSDLTETEAKEHLILAEELENYTLQRFIWLKQLALLRNISVDEIMEELEIVPR